MDYDNRYVVSSLELHLFFARIMKEHALFLRAGFTPRDATFSKRAGEFQQNFEQILAKAVALSDCIVSPKTLASGEIVTQFTPGAEQQTQRLTGIRIDQSITARERRLRADNTPNVTTDLVRQVRRLNQAAIRQLNGLIAFKEEILSNVRACRMFTMNYPLLIEHILREAKLYRESLSNFEAGQDWDCRGMRRMEQFWNQIMMEHALFIRGLLDPSEAELITASDGFAQEYTTLLARAREVSDQTLVRKESLRETMKFKEFKEAGAEGIQACKIQSLILPLLADHVLREANHYIRLLQE